jgi:hypothetical protein
MDITRPQGEYHSAAGGISHNLRSKLHIKIAYHAIAPARELFLSVKSKTPAGVTDGSL